MYLSFAQFLGEIIQHSSSMHVYMHEYLAKCLEELWYHVFGKIGQIEKDIKSHESLMGRIYIMSDSWD